MFDLQPHNDKIIISVNDHDNNDDNDNNNDNDNANDNANDNDNNVNSEMNKMSSSYDECLWILGV